MSEQHGASEEKFGRDLGLVHEVVVTGRKVGAGKEFWGKLAHNQELFKRVVQMVLVDEVEDTSIQLDTPESHLQAQEIMGENFFGIEHAVKHFKVKPTVKQLHALAEIPFTPEELTACRDTHALVADFGLSILDVRRVVPKGTFFAKNKEAWYNIQDFAKERAEACWRLVLKAPVTDSTSKNWDEQQGLLDKELEEVPSARVMVYAIIGHFLATGKRLLEGVHVRTSSLDSDGCHVYIGNFDATGLYVYSYWDSYRNDDLGLASSRKAKEGS